MLPQLGHGTFMEEAEGFEPSGPLARTSWLATKRHQPLGHASVFAALSLLQFTGLVHPRARVSHVMLSHLIGRRISCVVPVRVTRDWDLNVGFPLVSHDVIDLKHSAAGTMAMV